MSLFTLAVRPTNCLVIQSTHRQKPRALQSGVSEVEQFLTKQGLNSQSILEATKGVTSKAEEAINYASPTVKSTAGTLSATNPQLLAKYALGLAALYYIVSSRPARCSVAWMHLARPRAVID